MTTFDKISYWSTRAERQLEPLVGAEASRHGIRCALIQFAAQTAMPRDELDRLLDDEG
jgi:hypothetical protein